MSLGLVSFIVAGFEQAVGLARGVPDIKQAEQATVPAADMVRANTLAIGLRDQVQDLQSQFRTISWPSLALFTAITTVGGAADATKHLESRTRELLPALPTQTSVPALYGGLPQFWFNELLAAKYFLEIIDGERSTADLQYGSDLTWDLILSLWPVVGEGVLIYEAAFGQTLVGGHSISAAERVASGLGIILPQIIARSARVAVRVGAEAVLVTRRAVTLALDDLKVYKLLGAARRIPFSVELAAGFRALPEYSFQELRALLAKLRLGNPLKPADLARLNYFFIRMLDLSRLAQWLRIIDTELGAGAKGFQKLQGVKLMAKEELALRTLAERSADLVVALPKTLPIDYPALTKASGIKYPDGIWRGETFDLLVLETPSLSNAVGNIGRKQSQTSTVLVSLLDGAKLSSTDLSRGLPKLWAHPDYVSISRVVILDGAGFTVYNRPDTFVYAFMYGLTRIGLSDPKALSRMIEALQAEPSDTAR